ncbi:hypothetical protein HG535_0F02930 [Zygotorulaspora mrakii]|uniref:DNA primase n=1 Tax=Zygotorulaspora mrakii TaxID=42260 RepID=A0A7H9B7S0_ZYGMR|nr:uncharacterized protein HG535_0F02930 [Zygotorulaspora mrakii]QLG73782.1 hypothetical protein HG535_0F02930 [Zygotorulaspora mrakii]
MTEDQITGVVAKKEQPSTPSSSDMQFYYQYLYPYKSIFQWLNHSPKPGRDMINREFALKFRSGAYKRYVSFSSVQEFKSQIEKANPDRFEIGAVFNRPPKERDTILKTELQALEKELVFDIDMDDYDVYRTCCSGAQVCDKCWKFIGLAMKVMNVTLTDDFGYNDFMWVFSGRRGAHCWVSDKRARVLGDIHRRNVIDYLNVVKDRKGDKRLNLKRPLHPHLVRSLEILKPHFAAIILDEQNPWEDDLRAFDTLLGGLHDKQLIEALKVHWTKNSGRSSREKWNDIDVIASKEIKSNKKNEFAIRLRECKEDLVMATLYPKLDIEVSKLTSHLLKSPFCVHPNSGKVSVPIDETFRLEDAPRLIDLQIEMERNNNNVEKTSLQPFIENFQRYTNQLMKQELGSIKRERVEEQDALDF